jgi:hypothetical protein
MCEIITHLYGPHLQGVTFAVEEDKIPDPAQVCLLRPDAVVAGADSVAHTVQEFRHGEMSLRKMV